VLATLLNALESGEFTRFSLAKLETGEWYLSVAGRDVKDTASVAHGEAGMDLHTVVTTAITTMKEKQSGAWFETRKKSHTVTINPAAGLSVSELQKLLGL